jgi:hypothetical protein
MKICVVNESCVAEDQCWTLQFAGDRRAMTGDGNSEKLGITGAFLQQRRIASW